MSSWMRGAGLVASGRLLYSGQAGAVREGRLEAFRSGERFEDKREVGGQRQEGARAAGGGSSPPRGGGAHKCILCCGGGCRGGQYGEERDNLRAEGATCRLAQPHRRALGPETAPANSPSPAKLSWRCGPDGSKNVQLWSKAAGAAQTAPDAAALYCLIRRQQYNSHSLLPVSFALSACAPAQATF